MRWLGLVLATVGGFFMLCSLLLGGEKAILPAVVWGLLCAIGAITVAKNPSCE